MAAINHVLKKLLYSHSLKSPYPSTVGNSKLCLHFSFFQHFDEELSEPKERM
jgi:hypothetical protein